METKAMKEKTTAASILWPWPGCLLNLLLGLGGQGAARHNVTLLDCAADLF